ncbi:MAG: hypothetical protein J3R72DRAFT_479360 [Linnemannia gamsii]|nr:MAG: hypothetical protein J3R72DRAFT_479360 [Linnemannia gamsii]
MEVDLDCIASNPNSTALYGIGKAEGSRGILNTLIFRSNDNPANVTDITWHFEASVSPGEGPDDHYKYSRFGNVDCAASSSGEFTAFFFNPLYSVTGSSKLSFYIEKDGVETVVHAVMDETASVIRFGLVDQSTGYIQLAAVWKLVDGRFMVGKLTDNLPKLPKPKATTYKTDYSPAAPVNSDQRHMVYMNGTLYMYSDSTGLTSSFPFPSVLVTPIQKNIHRAFPIANNTRNMFFQGPDKPLHT